MTLTSRPLEICLLPPTHLPWCPNYSLKFPGEPSHLDLVHAELLGTIRENLLLLFTVPRMTFPCHMLSYSFLSWRPPAYQNPSKHMMPRTGVLTQLGSAVLSGVPSIPQGPSEDWVTISQAFPQPLVEPAGPLPCKEPAGPSPQEPAGPPPQEPAGPDLQAALGGTGGEKPMREQARDSTLLWTSSEKQSRNNNEPNDIGGCPANLADLGQIEMHQNVTLSQGSAFHRVFHRGNWASVPERAAHGQQGVLSTCAQRGALCFRHQLPPGRNSVADFSGRDSGPRKSPLPPALKGHPGSCLHLESWALGSDGIRRVCSCR